MPRHSRLATRVLHALVAFSLLLTSVPASTAAIAQTGEPPTTPMTPPPSEPPTATPADATPIPTELSATPPYSLIPNPLFPMTHTLYFPLVARDYTGGPQAGVALDKRVAPWLALAGDVVTYTLVVTNTGDLVLRDGVLVDRGPEELEVVEGVRRSEAGTALERRAAGAGPNGERDLPGAHRRGQCDACDAEHRHVQRR